MNLENYAYEIIKKDGLDCKLSKEQAVAVAYHLNKKNHEITKLNRTIEDGKLLLRSILEHKGRIIK